MVDQITLLLAAPIVKAILDNFYEGIGSKLGETAVEKLPKKVKQLGQLIWERCIQDKSETGELLQKAANGSTDDQEKLTEYLHKILETDSPLKQEVQKLIEEIHLEIHNDSGGVNQYNYGGTNFQNKVDGGVVNQANSITQNYYSRLPKS